ncbi:hypothetical protein WSM22_31980 [Cytophagales bacterium WSM2-2]|nr:hypothetical protein WSM22_31980 [Cytophagales bacterium WSM2-2]
MKKGKVLSFIILLWAPLLVLAQNQQYAFRVLANKGTNEVKSGDTWQPLKTGVQLKVGDELKISTNASVGLVSSSGKPLEVKEAKVHKVVDLLAKVGNSQSVLNKYTDFILSSNSDEAKKRNRLSATGAVHRGTGDITIMLPESQQAEVYNNTVIFSWQAVSSKAPFVVTFKNRFDEDLLKVETGDMKVEIDLNNPKFQNESMLFVEVKSKEDGKGKSEQSVIKKITPKRQEAVKADLGKLTDLSEETAFNKFILASFYEENKLLIDAMTCYEQAIKLDAENPTYKEAYEEFLIRNKLKKVK